MTAGQQHDEDRPPEPLVEHRDDSTSPTIAQADDDVARMVLQEQGVPVDPAESDGPTGRSDPRPG